MPDLVHERDVHARPQLLDGLAARLEIVAEQRDPVGQLAEPVDAPLGQRMPRVQPVEPWARAGRLVGDQDRHVLQRPHHVLRQPVEHLVDQPLELVVGNAHHAPIIAERTEVAPPRPRRAERGTRPPSRNGPGQAETPARSRTSRVAARMLRSEATVSS